MSPTNKPSPAKKQKKKRRVSKHILESREVQQNINKSDISKNKKRKSQKIKDPKEAAAYLESWKSFNDEKDQDGSLSVTSTQRWKFNKNDQSWLIRHMYCSDKLNKSTFDIMIEYLRLAANTTKIRVREDAVKRALRYKNWEKSGKEGKTEHLENDVGSKNEETIGDNEQGESGEDQDEWVKLDSKAKRKEYKRARKVLESVVILQEE